MSSLRGCCVILFDRPAIYLARTGIQEERKKRATIVKSHLPTHFPPFVSFLEASRSRLRPGKRSLGRRETAVRPTSGVGENGGAKASDARSGGQQLEEPAGALRPLRPPRRRPVTAPGLGLGAARRRARRPARGTAECTQRYKGRTFFKQLWGGSLFFNFLKNMH